jgi:predicted enzyme related to lactoylglutathione lyase
MSSSSDRGLFVWHEVGTSDLRAGEDFYAKVAGWKAESWSQNPSYKLFVARREAKAGLYLINETVNAVPTPPSWLTYIGTPDVDATVRQAAWRTSRIRRARHSRSRRRSSALDIRIRSLAIFRGTSF